MINALGVGLEPTIRFLCREAPDFDAFERWILRQVGELKPDSIAAFNAFLSGGVNRRAENSATVLTADDHRCFSEHGYLILKNAVTDEESQAAQDAVWEFLGADRNDPATWYTAHSARQGIMVQLFHHPALEPSRRSERIRSAFAELYGHERLLVTTDRVSFNPPERKDWKFPGPHLHWDVSLAQPIPFALQGLLHLTDTGADQGAFTLVPGFHRCVGSWLESLPPGTDPRRHILHTPDALALTADRGDLIIWHQALPHGSRPNTADFPRIVQYIKWQALDQQHEAAWK